MQSAPVNIVRQAPEGVRPCRLLALEQYSARWQFEQCFDFCSSVPSTPHFAHLSPVLLFAVVEFLEGQWMNLVSRFMGNVCCYSSPPRLAKSEQKLIFSHACPPTCMHSIMMHMIVLSCNLNTLTWCACHSKIPDTHDGVY